MFSKTDLPKNSSYLYIGVYDFAGFFPYILMGWVIKLTDILAYSSKLIWLSAYVYDILNCRVLGFHSLWRSSRMLGVKTLAFVREKISTIRSATSNIPFIDVYLWEPVGALISTVLSQMILGSRVYAVCCL